MAEIALSSGPWSLTLPGSMHQFLLSQLYPGDGDEHGAVITAGIATTADGRTRLLARELHLAIDGKDYVPGKRGYRMLKAEFIRKHITACRDQRLVYLAIHNHGGSTSVAFSRDDLNSHERGYPALLDIANGMPVGALVFAPRAIAGDIWLPNQRRVALDRAIVVGTQRTVLTPLPELADAGAASQYGRQTLLFGSRGQAILGAAKVGIIGLGGVGSLLAQYLGHLGVGQFVLIDPDRIEPTNLPRVVGATRWDARCQLLRPWLPTGLASLIATTATRKVDIAARVIRRANPTARVERFTERLETMRATNALHGCDYIFLAADSMTARLVFNQIIHQHLIPGVQIGSKIAPDKAGTIDDVFSIVRPVTPDGGCLWCNQLINPAKLQEEGQTEHERRAQRYVDDPDVHAPSVITLNAVGAAHAANDFLFYMTGLTAPDAQLWYAKHAPIIRRSQLIEPRRDPDCTECGQSRHSRRAYGNALPLTLRDTIRA